MRLRSRLASVALAAAALVFTPAARAAAKKPVGAEIPAWQKTPEFHRAHTLAVTGTALIATSVAGYTVMAVGLAMRANATTYLSSTSVQEDEARRDDYARRQTAGGTMALVGGISAGALMTTGLVLAIVGRTKAMRLVPKVEPQFTRHGLGLGWTMRF